jgi:hypothetical protein
MRRWGVVAMSVGAYFALWLIPAPGIDHELLAAARRSGGMFGLFESPLPEISLAGSSLVWLVLVRGALLVLPRPSRAWAIAGFVAYVLIALASGFTTAVYLESVGVSSMYGEPVVNPGWGFRLTLGLTYAASAALTWGLATAITRTGLAHGSLLLAGASLGMHALVYLASLGPLLQTAGLSLSVIGAPLLGTVPLIVGLIALWRWSPASWPLPLLRDAAFLGPMDVMVLPYVLGGLMISPTLLAAMVVPASEVSIFFSEHAQLLEPMLATGTAIGLAVWLANRPRGGRAAWSSRSECRW